MSFSQKAYEKGSIIIMNKVTAYLPFIKTFKNYRRENFKFDLMAALTTLVVSIPQCMACALIIGIPPVYGLYTAVFSIFIAALLGSSEYLITGPTNAIGLLIVGALGKFIPAADITSQSTHFFMMLFLLTLTVGIIQLLMGLLHFGKILDYVSHAVMTGFMSGAGLLIAIGQLQDFFGLNIKGFSNMPAYKKIWEIILNVPHANLWATGIAVSVLVVVIVCKKVIPKVPTPFFVIIAAAAVCGFGGIGAAQGVKLTQPFATALPKPVGLDLSQLFSNGSLWRCAIPIAIVGLVEAISISKSLSIKTGEEVNFDQEFRVQGVTNIFTSFFQGIVSSGSFSKTATNFMAGAKTRLAGMLSGVFLAITLLFLANYAKYIPIAALSGILMYIAWGVMDIKGVREQVKIGGPDRYIILITFAATLFIDLDWAVYLGIILSVVIYLIHNNKASTKILVPSVSHEGMYKEREINWVDTHETDILMIQFEGDLYFGSSNDVDHKLKKVFDHAKGFVLRMKGVTDIDTTMLEVLKGFCHRAKDTGKIVVFSGLSTDIHKKLVRCGIAEIVGEENIVMAKDYIMEASGEAVRLIAAKIKQNQETS